MEFNSVKSAARNVNAGTAGVNALDSIFDTARKTAPDFTKISTTARKARAQVANAAMTADARVAMTGLSQVGESKRNDDSVKALKKDGNQRLDNFRKAGILGAFRSVATGGVLGIERRQNEKDKAARIAREEEHMRSIERIYQERSNAPSAPKYEPKPFRDAPEPTAVAPTLEIPGEQSSNSSVTPVNLSQGSVPGIRKLAFDYMTKEKGLSRNHALGLISNGDRESGWKLNNPGDGGFSNGIFQWHKGRLSRMQAAVPDWKTNWKGQIDYALAEQGEPGQEYLRTSFTTPESAAEFWTRRWERPLHVERDVLKNNQFIRSYSF